MPLAIASGMKKTLVLAISVLMMAAPLAAGQRGGSPKPVKTHAPAPKTTTHAGGHAAPKTTVHSSPVKVAKAPKATKTTIRTTTPAMKPAKATKTTTTTKPAKTTKAATPTTVVTTPPLTKVQQKLQKNTNLASKLQSRLPAGTNLTLASSGFRNLGQFVAAVNVSNNLGIPFAQLKTRMVDQGMSLGQAIQDTRPRTTDTTVVVRRAESDADVLIRTTEQAPVAKKKVTKSTRGVK